MTNFFEAVAREKPLQIVGAINAYAAIMAQKVGFKALYLSGAGVANASYGLPDLGMTTLDNVLEDVARITAVVPLPLLVDIDTGWGNSFMIARTIKAMIRAGAAAVHIEDQPAIKRCGHREGKALVPMETMVERIKAAVDARTDPHFAIMARCDAYAVEGIEGFITRALAYKDAGADMLFAEAIESLENYQMIKSRIGLPLLANLTEFGKTPPFTIEELFHSGVDMALYPLSAARAMYASALNVYKDIRAHGSQINSLPFMQTRGELYEFLNYEEYERQADKLHNRL